MDQDFARLPLDRKIEQDVLVYRVIVVKIVRAVLVEPNRFASIDVTSKDASREFVVARPRVRIPRSRIRSAVINKVEFRIVGDPGPCATAAYFPCIRGPSLDAEILPPVLRIKRLEPWTDQHVFVRACSVARPRDF